MKNRDSFCLLFIVLVFSILYGCRKVPTHGTIGGNRPAKIILPRDYDDAKKYPVLVMLHGYASTGDRQTRYLGFDKHVDEKQFILVIPEGKKDKLGFQHWNATDACCDFYHSNTNDAKFLMSLVDELIEKYNIDSDRIYFTGHSNGSFMSYAMACKYGGRISAIAAFAGMSSFDLSQCPSTEPVSVLHIHGTLDPTIRYSGAARNLNLKGYPSAEKSVENWRVRNHCAESPVIKNAINLSTAIPGNESTRKRWTSCDNLTKIELWTIKGGTHTPALSPSYPEYVLDFLLAN